MTGARRALAGLFIVLGLVALAALVARPLLEQRIVEAVRRSAQAAGATIGAIEFSWQGPLRLTDVVIDREDTGRVRIARVDVRFDYRGGRDPRAHVRGFSLQDIRIRRGNMGLEMEEASFDVLSWEVQDGTEHLRLRQLPSGGELEARWKSASLLLDLGLSLARLDLRGARIQWAGENVLHPGVLGGKAVFARSNLALRSQGDLTTEGARLALPRALASGAAAAGEPVAGKLDWEIVREGAQLDVRQATVRVGGVHLAGRGRVDGFGSDDARLHAAITAETEIGAVFQATGLRWPASLGASDTGPLGTAWLAVDLEGSLARPAELRVAPRLRFASAPRPVQHLQYLAQPFHYQPTGTSLRLDVRDGAPDFIALAAVPPLFVRALLISEDAGFFGHPGVDVAEIPVAWAENVERGRFRGASTLTQQLVKNLFLTAEKSYGRKLEEAALALIVDAALTKARILEIYLNVIEWGPGVYGLVPAARHYFGKPPGALTPREMAFLVCLIPSPVRYHQAHVAGRVGPGMDQLVANLLAKLHSVGGLNAAEYDNALADDLQFAPET